jgi:hypothetical protein
MSKNTVNLLQEGLQEGYSLEKRRGGGSGLQIETKIEIFPLPVMGGLDGFLGP